MKLLLISYNQAIGDEVMASLRKCRIEGYTELPVVYGVGKHSGPHMGTHIWPGVNSLLMIACEEEAKDQLLIEVRRLKGSYGKEGIKAFVMPLDDLV